jgi:hypothetical protein
MNVFSQLIYARLHQTASDLAESISGLIWQNTTSKKLKFYDGDEVKELVDLNSEQTIINKVITGNTAADLKPDGENLLTLPVATDTLVGRNTEDVLTNKTITGNIAATLMPDTENILTFPITTDTLVARDTVDTLTNKTLDTPTVNNGVLNSPNIFTPSTDIITISHQETPVPPSIGSIKLYPKASNKLFLLGSDNVERPVGSGGGGSSLIWEKLGGISPEDESQDGIKLESFSNLDTQEMFLTVNVPSDFVPGTPVKLTNGAFFTSVTSGNVRFRTQTAILRADTTVLGTYSNIHTSVNAQTIVSAVANRMTVTGDIDLTDEDGLINGVSVQAGDKLRIRLYRDIASETSGAAGKAKLMINNLEIKFSV